MVLRFFFLSSRYFFEIAHTNVLTFLRHGKKGNSWSYRVLSTVAWFSSLLYYRAYIKYLTLCTVHLLLHPFRHCLAIKIQAKQKGQKNTFRCAYALARTQIYLWMMHNNSQSHHGSSSPFKVARLILWIDLTTNTRPNTRPNPRPYSLLNIQSCIRILQNFLRLFFFSSPSSARDRHRWAINVNSWWVKLQFNATGHNHIQHFMYYAYISKYSFVLVYLMRVLYVAHRCWSAMQLHQYQCVRVCVYASIYASTRKQFYCALNYVLF